MIERAKQELLPLTYRWVSPENVEYYIKYECKENRLTQKIKINIFLHKITKTSQELVAFTN